MSLDRFKQVNSLKRDLFGVPVVCTTSYSVAEFDEYVKKALYDKGLVYRQLNNFSRRISRNVDQAHEAERKSIQFLYLALNDLNINFYIQRSSEFSDFYKGSDFLLSLNKVKNIENKNTKIYNEDVGNDILKNSIIFSVDVASTRNKIDIFKKLDEIKENDEKENGGAKIKYLKFHDENKNKNIYAETNDVLRLIFIPPKSVLEMGDEAFKYLLNQYKFLYSFLWQVELQLKKKVEYYKNKESDKAIFFQTRLNIINHLIEEIKKSDYELYIPTYKKQIIENQLKEVYSDKDDIRISGFPDFI